MPRSWRPPPTASPRGWLSLATLNRNGSRVSAKLGAPEARQTDSVPSPTPTLPVVIVANPWAWSLDTVIAAIGAFATVVVAAWALFATLRANRLQREARERDRRATFAAAIVLFADTWKPSGSGTRAESQDAQFDLFTIAAQTSPAALDIAQWAHDSLHEADGVAIRYEVRHANDLHVPERALLVSPAILDLKVRALNWVSTGKLSRSPLHAYPDSATE